MIAKEIVCIHCKAELELDDNERNKGEFICPECNYTVTEDNLKEFKSKKRKFKIGGFFLLLSAPTVLSIPYGDPTTPTLYSMIIAFWIFYGGIMGLSGKSVPIFFGFISIVMPIIGLFLAYIAPSHSFTRGALLLFCTPGLVLSTAALYFTSQGKVAIIINNVAV